MPTTRDIDPSDNAECGRISIGGNSSAEINKLSSELNSRLSRELDDMMCSVNSQIQRAISDAISNQILPQIQSALSAGSGHSTQSRWNVPPERPEVNSEGLQNINPKDSSASKPNCNRQNDGVVDPKAYDTHKFHEVMLINFFTHVSRFYTLWFVGISNKESSRRRTVVFLKKAN